MFYSQPVLSSSSYKSSAEWCLLPTIVCPLMVIEPLFVNLNRVFTGGTYTPFTVSFPNIYIAALSRSK